MRDGHVYKTVELTGTSGSSLESAINNAIRTASRTLRHLRWFEVVEVRGDIESGQALHWQVTLKVGFTLDPPDAGRPASRSSTMGSRRTQTRRRRSGSRR